jgi:hypothetical protein
VHSQNDSTAAQRFLLSLVILGNGSAGKGYHRSNPARPETVQLCRRPRMIALRLALPAVLAAAAVAACLTYVVTPPARVEADERLPPTVPNLTGPETKASTRIDQPTKAEKNTAEAYREAAAAILSRAANARASSGTDKQPITKRIPLPKRRPVIAP